MTLEDSTTYQHILQKGRLEATQSLILQQGTKRFGLAAPETTSAIRGITDRERLERLAIRILDAADWNDLLASS